MQDDRLRVRIRIPSRLADLELVAAAAEAFLSHVGLVGQDLERSALAVREAAANAVEHGNGADAELPVRVVMEASASAVRIAVSDQGDGFDPLNLPDPLAPENLLKPRGRGVFLIRSFVDEVDFTFAEGGGTEMVIKLHLPRPAAGPEAAADG